MIQSLDPRIQRLNIDDSQWTAPIQVLGEDQLPTFQVFQKVKENKPFEHVGIVHAPSLEMAFLFAKEQYSRRGNETVAMSVVATADVQTSDFTEGEVNVLDTLPAQEPKAGEITFEVFYLKKRGKQHTHAGTVKAASPADALLLAKLELYITPCQNVWIVPTAALMATESDDKDIWSTLNEKKYREAIAYKAADKIKAYKEQHGT